MRNGQLAFGRFWWRDLSFQEARGGRTNRSLHFETRLFNALPWVSFEGKISDRKDDQGNVIDWSTLVSPLPRADILKSSAGNSNLFTFTVNTAEFSWLPSTSSALSFFGFTRVSLQDPEKMPFEEMCIYLETIFQRKDTCCQCCLSALEKRCVYCTDACGWHRCVRYCQKHHLTLSDIAGYRWAPSSLYNLDGHDIEATVLQMLRHANPSTAILSMLKKLRENNILLESKYTSLQKFVLESTGAIYDSDPSHGRPNQNLVLSHASFRPDISASKAYVEVELEKLLEKLQKIWDVNTNSYRHYSDVLPPRPVPSQYQAFLQIQHRLENALPCLVCIAAPAGFGKTELVSALLHYLITKGIHWECIAVTGVAASQIAGATVHSLIQASAEGYSSLFSNA